MIYLMLLCNCKLVHESICTHYKTNKKKMFIYICINRTQLFIIAYKVTMLTTIMMVGKHSLIHTHKHIIYWKQKQL